MPRKVTDEAPAAVQKAYEFVLWLVKKVENFPKSHKFTIGDRLAASGLDLLTTLVEAAYTRNKAQLLQSASGKVNATRYLLRMAKDLHLMSIESYGFSAENLDEIGRMVGGWLRSNASPPAPQVTQ